jgi:hypothetical protein
VKFDVFFLSRLSLGNLSGLLTDSLVLFSQRLEVKAAIFYHPFSSEAFFGTWK